VKTAARAAVWTIVSIAALKLAIHLWAAHNYGYFVDELYYIACGQHLDWGYVDQPPLIAGFARLVHVLLGDSLNALRFLPAVAGAALIVLTGLLARELGGGAFAQGFAALCALCAPGLLAANSLFTMNAFEPVFWTACAWLFARIVNTGDQKLWLWIGALAGLGLENKHSMLIFAAGLVLGVALTKQRRAFAQPWIWIGAAIAVALFLPNLIWNIQHHFPFLELQANIRRSGRNVDLSPINFFAQETLAMLPVALPVWLAGIWFFFSHGGREYRALGWAWLFAASVIVLVSPRIYYLFPAFPVLFAAGGVQWERLVNRPILRFALAGLIVIAGVLLAPLAVPVLPVETYMRYARTLHLQQPAIETHRLGPLPQIYADQFGWEEMAATVARVYNQLPRDVQSKTAVFAQNYGEAGAIDFFGPMFGLPKAISGHQNYFYWGPRGYTGESMIVLDDTQEVLERLFTHVEKVAHVEHPYSMPYEHFDVYYCSGLRGSLQELWPRLKRWG
jgi:4-amino-4-deoxy-L-arabinose transferase-like glycosyltransferase